MRRRGQVSRRTRRCAARPPAEPCPAPRAAWTDRLDVLPAQARQRRVTGARRVPLPPARVAAGRRQEVQETSSGGSARWALQRRRPCPSARSCGRRVPEDGGTAGPVGSPGSPRRCRAVPHRHFPRSSAAVEGASANPGLPSAGPGSSVPDPAVRRPRHCLEAWATEATLPTTRRSAALAGAAEAADLLDVPSSLGMLEVEDLGPRPSEVEGDVRDLVVQGVGRVRHDSPRRPPARSMVKPCPHSGQVTPALVWPSWLTRR